MTRAWSRLGVLGLFIAPIFPAACETGGVVGGACIEGFTVCGGECVNLSLDESNCGSCGRDCQPGVSCINSVCGGGSGGTGGSAGDGSATGGAAGGDFPPDGSAGMTGGGGSSASGGSGGSSASGGSAGAAGGDGGCTPPFDTAQQCGDCNTSCSNPTPLCAPVDGNFACVALCTPPLVACGGKCVDTNTDPDHCGRCFNRCDSRLCQAGVCVGATVGHITLACMNHEQAIQSSQQTVLMGNAIFLTLKTPLRILAYAQHVPAAAKNRVNQVITWAATARSRTFTITEAATSAQVVADLNIFDYEVLLVYDQPSAPAGALATVGTAWNATVDSYARAGGSIVVLSSGMGRAEMDQLMTNAGLLPVTAETNITFSQLHNRAPADAIGVNVITPFLGLRETCTFTTSAAQSSSTVFVITDSAPEAGIGDPVVVHRIQAP